MPVILRASRRPVPSEAEGIPILLSSVRDLLAGIEEEIWRIALFFWRLGRVARYEREVVAIRQESLVEDIAESRRERAKVDRLFATPTTPVFGVGDDMHPDEVISRPGKAIKELALLEGFPEVPDATDLTPAEAMTLVCAIVGVGEVYIYDEGFPRFPGIPDNVLPEDFKAWNAGMVRSAWKVIATTAGVSLETP